MNSPARILPFVLTATLLAGCTVGPDYHPPTTAAPEQWSSALAGGETNLPAAGASWWKTFNDPELDSLIARAAQSNITLRAAWARVRQARAALGIAAASARPALNATGSYTRERYSAQGFPPIPPPIPLDANVYQVGFDAAWELDIFGGTRRAVQAAAADIAAAEFGRRDLLVSLYGEVARNYVQARAMQRRLGIARDNIKAQRELLALTRDLYNKGLTSQLDVEQADSLLASTEAQVPSLETGFQSAAYHLGVLLGQPPGALVAELSADTPLPFPPPAVPVGLPADLMLRRPDIQRAERQLAAATARIGAASSDLFPKFSLTGDIGLQSISAGDWFTAGSRYWTAGPAVQWRIFDAGRIRANIHAQTARQEEALANYEQTALAAFEEVENALTAYAREQIRRQSLARGVRDNQRAVELARDLYRNGLADFLRVLESQRALYESQDALVQSDHAIATDLVALCKALGGGWEQKQ
ncbi:MAG: efflux transporter outer membrane subunit [Verrucomicrobiota bacterium]|jgi:NodT family efflux transporter outer membrane factor (OMF) lipoprotein